MSQNIYPSLLLNELHNYFPDILYNPGRFRTVQDLLSYIRSVADTNPYVRGLSQYNNHISNTRINESRTPHRNYSIPSYASTFVRNPNSTSAPIFTTVIDEMPTNTWSEFPFNTIRSPSNQGMPSILTVLTELLGSPSTNPLQNFLDQRVVVAPTATQIEQATTVEIVSTAQDNLCTICQDNIETGQQARKINLCRHIFHKDCIDTWLQTNVHCPTCRHDIRDMEDNERREPQPVPENHRRTNIRNNTNNS